MAETGTAGLDTSKTILTSKAVAAIKCLENMRASERQCTRRAMHTCRETTRVPILLLAPGLTNVELWSMHLPSRARGRRYEGDLPFPSPPSSETRRYFGGAFTSYKLLEFRAEETQGPSTSLNWASSLFVVDDGAAMRNLETCWCIVSAIVGSISCKYKRHRHCATAVVRPNKCERRRVCMPTYQQGILVTKVQP